MVFISVRIKCHIGVYTRVYTLSNYFVEMSVMATPKTKVERLPSRGKMSTGGGET